MGFSVYWLDVCMGLFFAYEPISFANKAKGLVGAPTQKAQYPLIREYPLNDLRIPNML